MRDKSIIKEFFILAIVGMLLVGPITSYSISNVFMEEYVKTTHERNQEYVVGLKKSIESDLKEIEGVVKSIASGVMYKDFNNDDVDLNAFEENYSEYFSKIIAEEDYISNSIYIYLNPHLDHQAHDVWITIDEAGRITRHDEIPIERYEANENMDWFYKPLEKNESIWVDPYVNRYNELISSFVVPMANERQQIGIIGMYYRFAALKDMFKTYAPYEESITWIENKEGIIIYHSDDIDKSMDIKSDTLNYGKDYQIYKEEIYNGWFVNYCVPFKGINKVRNRMIRNSIGILLAFLVTYIYLINRYRIKYNAIFSEVLNVLVKIKNGDLTKKIKIYQMDEIGKMSTAINSATDSILELTKHQADLAYLNQVTRLPNKNRLYKDILSMGEEFSSFSLYFIDIDNFKMINDIIGHRMGDRFLNLIAERLTKLKTNYLNLYHISGDEFIIIDYSDRHQENIESYSRMILKAFENTFVDDNHEFHITASMGVCIYRKHAYNVDELIRFAEIAMYEAKSLGKNNMIIFDKEMSDKIITYNHLERNFKNAILNDEFIVYYQPKVIGKNNSILSMEALVRWRHPDKGILSPAHFIDYAEKSGYIIELGEIVLRKACRQIVSWNKKYSKNYSVAVNLSMMQLLQEDIVSRTIKVLQEEGLKPSLLEYEITESMVITERQSSIDKLNQLKDLGIKISLDDFGTGYSTLNNIFDLPITGIKIDRSLINNVAKGSAEAKFAKGIIDIVHNMDIEVVAEGVETIEQVDILNDYGCDYLQGYYFSKPLSSDDFVSKIIGE